VTVVAPAGPAGRLTLLPAGPLAVRIEVEGLPVEELTAGTRLVVGTAVLVVEPEPSGPSVTPGSGGLGEGPGGPRRPARVVTAGTVEPGDPVSIDAVAVPTGDVLDLHPFAPRDVPGAVTAFLEEAATAARSEVRLIHGRGRGVQRTVVRRLLAGSPLVASFADAPAERGGWGATLVRLRDRVPAAGEPDSAPGPPR
jgi:hypothetical protein